VIVFNILALPMLAIGFGGAYALGWMLGSTGEDLLMVLAGPLLVICDLVYRQRHKTTDRWALHPRVFRELWTIASIATTLFRGRLGDRREPIALTAYKTCNSHCL
jgi:hypothetical protein